MFRELGLDRGMWVERVALGGARRVPQGGCLEKPPA